MFNSQVNSNLMPTLSGKVIIHVKHTLYTRYTGRGRIKADTVISIAQPSGAMLSGTYTQHQPVSGSHSQIDVNELYASDNGDGRPSAQSYMDFYLTIGSAIFILKCDITLSCANHGSVETTCGSGGISSQVNLYFTNTNYKIIGENSCSFNTGYCETESGRTDIIEYDVTLGE